METIEDLLIRHEGLRLKPYKCSAGKTTIGVGRNLTDNGISEAEAMLLLENDIQNCSMEAMDTINNFFALSKNRRNVVVSMVFNLGINRFKKFKKMIKAIHDEDFHEASL